MRIWRVKHYLGEPIIAEPDKCYAIGWFDVESLLSDIIPERVQAVRGHFTGVHYHEAGFETRP
jgi:hypothetical protein